jgi:hypothetical protein
MPLNNVKSNFFENLKWNLVKMSEMQKVSEVFKLNLNYYQRVAHKVILKSVVLVFQVSLFSPGGAIYIFPYYRIF